MSLHRRGRIKKFPAVTSQYFNGTTKNIVYYEKIFIKSISFFFKLLIRKLWSIIIVDKCVLDNEYCSMIQKWEQNSLDMYFDVSSVVEF